MSKILVKIVYGSDIRRFTLKTSPRPTFSEFNQIIHNLFSASIPSTKLSTSFFTIKYVDDENDHISLTHDLELDEAWQFASSCSNPLLRIILTPVSNQTTYSSNSSTTANTEPSTQISAPQGFDPRTRRRSSNSMLSLPMSLSQTVLPNTSIPDGTVVIANTYFVKTWTIQNDGNSPWPEGCKLAYFSGDFLSTTVESVKIPALQPNEEANVSIIVRAPEEIGSFNMQFKLQNPANGRFGERMGIDIIVTSHETMDTQGPINNNSSEQALDQLEEMGFPDRAVNKRLLESTPNLLNAIQSLLTQL